jgi:methyl-accepting chemotaxis protein
MALDIDALETSFDLLAPRGEELVDIFYARLFAAAPSVEPLFSATDMRRQKAKLLATLVLVAQLAARPRHAGPEAARAR